MARIDATEPFAIGARLVSDQLHRAHDAAALVIELLVVLTDEWQQLRQLEPGTAALNLRQLLPQARVQLVDRETAAPAGGRLRIGDSISCHRLV